MIKLHFTIILSLIFACNTYSQQSTIQERLGYSKNTKLLILHADDMGLSHSQNIATFESLNKGSVNSSSIMVPCPWFLEAAAYANSHPKADLGIHLTLTSEWGYYKWDPVLPASEVPSLVTAKGFFHPEFDNAGKDINVQEVEKELRAQIERALQFGINPTHFDSHMFTLLEDTRFLEVYLKLSREYKMPILLNNEYLSIDIDPYLIPEDVVVDNIIMAYDAVFDSGLEEFYTESMKNIKPGLSVLLLHTAFENEEMNAISNNSTYWGANWRQQDFDFFTSEKCEKLIQNEDIQLITWREIREKLLLNTTDIK